MKFFLRVASALLALGFSVLAYVWITLPDVRPLRTTNPKSTAFMELRAREAARVGKNLRHVHMWVPYSRISQNLKRAVLVAEDDAFWDHEGVDLEQIRQSIEVNMQRGKAVRGASTITQQLAKNLYLSPSRDPLRKLRELIIARRLESALPKARILEIYLNVIEWGDGIWGAEAASRTYFGIPASAVGPDQAALLAGAIVNPRRLNPARPTRGLLRRQATVLGRMRTVTPPPALPLTPPPAQPDEANEDEAPAPPAPPPADSLSPSPVPSTIEDVSPPP